MLRIGPLRPSFGSLRPQRYQAGALGGRCLAQPRPPPSTFRSLCGQATFSFTFHRRHYGASEVARPYPGRSSMGLRLQAASSRKECPPPRGLPPPLGCFSTFQRPVGQPGVAHQQCVEWRAASSDVFRAVGRLRTMAFYSKTLAKSRQRPVPCAPRCCLTSSSSLSRLGLEGL